AAGVVAGAPVMAPLAGLVHVDDLVVEPAAPAIGAAEPEADLDPLDGLNAHHGLGDAAVELEVPLDVASQPRRHPPRPRLDDAAEGVLVLLGVADGLDHGLARA